MKGDLKSFLGIITDNWREPDGNINDLLDFDSYHLIPNKPGAYIIIATDKKTKFIYPRGESRVIYIGKAKDLNKRLSSHYKTAKKFDKMSLEKRLEYWYYQRYQYIKEFGGALYWYTTRGPQSPEKLEHDLLASFYNRYYALPVGNGAFPKFH